MITLLVPVLGRAHQIKPLLQNIREATSIEHRIVFICSKGDDATKVCKKTNAETIVVPWEPGRADFAKKINYAYDAIVDEWYFQGATDLRFQERWASIALHIGERHGVGVVGTNDLGNPSVQRGNHATHILFSRAYIEEHGGTYDGSGKVFSEVYDHQFVDTEFVQTAQLRGQFKPSLDSVVEHLHPNWGKSGMDSTYEKALRETSEDRRIYTDRMRRMRTLESRRRRRR